MIRSTGQSQRDVANLLNIGSGSLVCKQLFALPDKLSKDQWLHRQVRQAEDRLAEAKANRGQTPFNA